MSKGPFMVDLRSTDFNKVMVYYEFYDEFIDIGKILESTNYTLNDFTARQLEALGLAEANMIEAEAFAHPYVPHRIMRYFIGTERGLELEARSMAGYPMEPEGSAKAEYSRPTWLKDEYERIPLLKAIDGKYTALFSPDDELDEDMKFEIGLYLLRGYNHPITAKHTADMMKQLRKGVELDLDVSIYNKLIYSAEQMKLIRKFFEYGYDVAPYLDGFNEDQLGEIYKGLRSGLDVSVYAKPKYDYNTMYTIRKCLKRGIEVSDYLNGNFNNGQLKAIFDGFLFNTSRKAIKNGWHVDVDQYAKPEYSAKEMLKSLSDQLGSIKTLVNPSDVDKTSDNA